MKPNLCQRPFFVAMVLILLFASLFLQGCGNTPGNKVISLMKSCDAGNEVACKELNDAL